MYALSFCYQQSRDFFNEIRETLRKFARIRCITALWERRILQSLGFFFSRPVARCIKTPQRLQLAFEFRVKRKSSVTRRLNHPRSNLERYIEPRVVKLFCFAAVRYSSHRDFVIGSSSVSLTLERKYLSAKVSVSREGTLERRGKRASFPRKVIQPRNLCERKSGLPNGYDETIPNDLWSNRARFHSHLLGNEFRVGRADK